MNALVPYVLHRGTKLWPDMQALSERQEELFGTVVEPIVRRIGEIHCSGFYAGFPEDEYLPGDESVLSDAIGLSLSLLLDPVTRGGLLLPDYVESEQEKLLDMIAARVNLCRRASRRRGRRPRHQLQKAQQALPHAAADLPHRAVLLRARRREKSPGHSAGSAGDPPPRRDRL